MFQSHNIPVLNASTKIHNCTIKNVLASGTKGVAYVCTDDTVLKTLRLSNQADLDAARNEGTLHSKAAKAGFAVPVLGHGIFTKQSGGTFTKQSNNTTTQQHKNESIVQLYMIHMGRGVTLKDILEKQGDTYLTKQKCQEIHKLLLSLLKTGINHGDVHAENIVSYKGKLMFIDFSESHELDPHLGAKQKEQLVKNLMFAQLSNLIETFLRFNLATTTTPFIVQLKKFIHQYLATFEITQNRNRILKHVKKISDHLALKKPEKLPGLWRDPLVRTYCVRRMRNEGDNASECLRELKQLAINNDKNKDEKLLPKKQQILHKRQQVQLNQNQQEVILLNWPSKPGHKIQKL